jgi:hypothetical protein
MCEYFGFGLVDFSVTVWRKSCNATRFNKFRHFFLLRKRNKGIKIKVKKKKCSGYSEWEKLHYKMKYYKKFNPTIYQSK